MIAEIEMAKQQQLLHELPVREAPPEERLPMEELLRRRRLMRVELDDFIRTLQQNDLPNFAMRVCRIAFAVAGTCSQFGCTPEFAHYAEAVKQVTEDGQRELDKALQVSDWHAVRVASAKMQLLWYGIAANLGLPYSLLMNYMHGCYMKKEDIRREDIVVILRKAGLRIDDPADNTGMAANDTTPPGEAP